MGLAPPALRPIYQRYRDSFGIAFGPTAMRHCPKSGTVHVH